MAPADRGLPQLVDDVLRRAPAARWLRRPEAGIRPGAGGRRRTSAGCWLGTRPGRQPPSSLRQLGCPINVCPPTRRRVFHEARMAMFPHLES